MYIPAHLHATQFTFDTIGIPQLRLIHQVMINGNLSAWHTIIIIQYIQVFPPRTPYISRLFEKGLEIIQKQAIVPAEAKI